ncbi:MAG: TIGR02444 family protein [Proteobacteria bacterium]|nr:TIGR02444 family protein [Pseudomonadota bacterium]
MTGDDNEFWRFSCEIYAAAGVAVECLRLQDKHDIDVNLLLFCAWLGVQSRVALGAEEIDLCRAETAAWCRSVLKPLRAARRSMKPIAEAATLRNAVKALELEAEKAQQAMLFALAERHWPRRAGVWLPSAGNRNIWTFCASYGLDASEVLPSLCSALSARGA